MYSVSIRSVVLLARSKTLGSGVLGQYSVRSFVGEIQDISVRCTRSVVLLVRSKTLGSDVLGHYSVSSSVGEIQDFMVRRIRSVFGQTFL